MANLKLSSFEVKSLINSYQSELRKLNFQIIRTQKTIQELEAQLDANQIELPEAPVETVLEPVAKKGPGRPKKTASAPSSPKKKPGRPKKTTSAATKQKKKPGRPKKQAETEITAKKKPGRPKKTTKKTRKRKKTGGYRLSDWDTFVINTIDAANKPLINSELLEAAKSHEVAKGMKEDDIKVKISQSIHKLANKRKTLAKTKYEGRGFSYATDKMTFSNGKLKKEFKR